MELALIKEIVQDAGFPVLKDSEYCKMYLKNHENCKNCEYHIGCSKMIEIGILIIDADHTVSEKIYSILKGDK